MSGTNPFPSALAEPGAARTIVLGAETRGAGFSASARGAAHLANDQFCMDFVRDADRESPGLPELLDEGGGFFDAGNLALPHAPLEQVDVVSTAAEAWLRDGKRLVLLGGDHLVKFALLSAVSRAFAGESIGIVYFDAHPDCARRDELFFGSILHHAWRLPGLAPDHTVITGLRQTNAEERDTLAAYRPCIVHASSFVRPGLDSVLAQIDAAVAGCSRIVLSIDLDGLRPSDAPAVESPYPGGPSLDELLIILRHLGATGRLVAADITEFLVACDPSKLTALAVARLVHEISAA